jgi:predicted PurR-regulated permease PerM
MAEGTPDEVAAASLVADADEVARASWSTVPWRTIVATVAVVLLTAISIALVLAAVRIIAWVIVGGFFAVVLAPAVRRLQQHLGDRRNVAIAIVVTATLAVVIGSMVVFIMPIRTQLVSIVTDLPGTVEDAADGRGPVGELVDRLGLVDYVNDHQSELERTIDNLTGSPFEMAQRAGGWILTFVTITLITVLLLSQASSIGAAALELVPFRRRDSVRRASLDAARAVSGYMVGNLLISLVAGTTALVFLLVMGVPNALVLGLLVAFADLIPLVGATLGAAVCVLAAFLYEPRAGVIAIVFFVVYQQIENYAIYPAVMARTVKVNPLVVLLSVLVGVELFGFVGALLAVPISGAVQVAVRATRREFDHEKLVLPPGVDTASD